MQKSTNNLKEVRKAQGFTLAQLSANTGVPVSSIGAFEKGTRPLKAEHRQVIENLLGVEIVETQQNIPEKKSLAIDEGSESYTVRLGIWREASNEKLEALLREYSDEKDWGAVKEITTELLNRKITDKLKGKK